MTLPKPKACTYNGAPGWCLDLRGLGMDRIYRRTKKELKDWVDLNVGDIQKHGANGQIPDERRIELMHVDQVAKELQVSPMEAMAFYREHATRLTPMALEIAVNEFIKSKRKAGKREPYIATLEWLLGALLKFHGNLNVHELTLAMVDAFADSRPWNLATRKRHTDYLRVFCDFCYRKKWVLRNVMLDMEPILVDHAPPAVLPVSDVKLLLSLGREQCPWLLPFIALQAFGAMRVSEAARVAQGGLNAFLKNEAIDLWGIHTKGRLRRLVELNPLDVTGKPFSPLGAWLKYDEGKPLLPGKIETAWKRLRYHAPGKLRVAWTPDCLRHTAVSMLYPTIGPARTAMYSGHSETVCEQHYRSRFEPAEVKEYWALTPEVIG